LRTLFAWSTASFSSFVIHKATSGISTNFCTVSNLSPEAHNLEIMRKTTSGKDRERMRETKYQM
jgi:hypothetical protein